MENNNIIEKETTPRKTVFVPDARTLSSEDLANLTDKEKAFAKDCEDKGVWLEVFCPKDKYLLEEEPIKLVEFCEETEEKLISGLNSSVLMAVVNYQSIRNFRNKTVHRAG